MKILNSQVIDLIKHVFLREPKEERISRSQFSAGKLELFSVLGGTIITWWYTDKTYKLIDNISFIIINNIDEFSDCDYKSINKIVKKTLCEICANKRIFNIDQIFFSECETLFESRVTNDIEFLSSTISSEIINNIRANVTRWCVVYSAPSLRGKSFTIPSEGIHVLNRLDKSAWEAMNSLGYPTDKLEPHTGKVMESNRFFLAVYNYLFITEESGTLKGTKFSSSLKLKILFSVIFSLISQKQDSVLQESSATSQDKCLQFPHYSSNINQISKSDIGILLPYYIESYFLTDEDIDAIIQWYADVNQIDDTLKNRIEKCGHFISHAMNSTGVDSFINYFIALDALFGKRGSVEKSIILGIGCLPDAEKWKDKVSWLFEFRSELVHGGSRYIEECPNYFKYYRHFLSEPLKDIEKLAFHSLFNSPQLSVNKGVNA